MLPQFIGIHGPMGSGKSTIADFLISEHGYIRVKIAEPLKNMIRSLLRDAGFDDDFIERCVEGTQEEKETPLDVFDGKSTRYAMMMLGKEWRDLIHPNLWVNISMSKVKTLLEAGKRVVCDDLRFPQEIATLRAGNVPGTYWKNDRPFLARPKTGHASEAGLPNELFNVLLINNGSVSGLLDAAQFALTLPMTGDLITLDVASQFSGGCGCGCGKN
jgi:hypothetical protein